MTIEPISSIMTAQAQGSTAQKTQTTAEPERQDRAVGAVQPAETVDKTTTVVENAQEKGTADSSEQSNKDQQASNEKVRKAVEKLNKSMANSEAVFGIHEETNRVTIKIVDKGTKEVIKELPPEKTLDMIAKVWEMAGILVDERR